MGVVGAGKSLQGQMLADKIGYKWFSLGKYLRESADEEAKARLASGKFFSDEEVIEIIGSEIGKNIGENTILDGFPRTKNQAEWLTKMHQNHEINIEAVIVLEVSQATLLKRLLSRGRDEDNEQVIKDRVALYQKETAPIVDWFEKKGVKVKRVDGEGTPEEISVKVLESLK